MRGSLYLRQRLDGRNKPASSSRGTSCLAYPLYPWVPQTSSAPLASGRRPGITGAQGETAFSTPQGKAPPSRSRGERIVLFRVRQKYPKTYLRIAPRSAFVKLDFQLRYRVGLCKLFICTRPGNPTVLAVCAKAYFVYPPYSKFILVSL